MAVKAVIFDWGGTLTPWHTIDHDALWRDLCLGYFAADQAAEVAARLREAELALWRQSERLHESASLELLCARAGVPTLPGGFWAGYFSAWDPHTFTDPDAPALLRSLRAQDIKVGVLSNTMWPRSAHERVFVRDGVDRLIDGAVYSSEIPWTKPHPEAFRAAMDAVGVDDPAACVFVGDRPFDDIYGAKRVGMRAVLLPNGDVPAFDGAVPDAVIGRLAELASHVESWA
jgi:putative hydrolase of the HAD superfamily